MTSSIQDTSKPRWQKAVLPVTATIQDAIANLVDSGAQIAMVVASDGTLSGTITDGDIRRGLLRGLGLGSGIDSVIHHDPLVVPPEFSREMVLQLMRSNKLHQMPVVNESRQLVGLHLLDELLERKARPNLMVIMAGGKGTRLRPHTEHCPKPLLPVAGKPMLEHIIERARAEGFHEFVLAVHYLGTMIEDHFGDGSRWQVRISYLREKMPLGTAGALSLLNTKASSPVLVSNGDVLTDIHYGDLLDFHCRQNALATMAVRLHELQHPFGVVQTSGIDITGFEEKPVLHSYVNAGIYVLEPAAFTCLNPGEVCDMPTLFSRLQARGDRTIVYPMHEPWLDVGRPEDYDKANNKS